MRSAPDPRMIPHPDMRSGPPRAPVRIPLEAGRPRRSEMNRSVHLPRPRMDRRMNSTTIDSVHSPGGPRKIIPEFPGFGVAILTLRA
jgi:hypothetical protein